jgi:hypothetical protein
VLAVTLGAVESTFAVVLATDGAPASPTLSETV